MDLERFERLVGEARGAEPGVAASKLREALSLWRGPPLAEFAYEEFARGEVGRLKERRLGALEERVEADLALGRHGDLAGELVGLVARHPLRERLRAQLVLVLYRSGRQAEALAAYQEARRMLREELGLEPSEELQQLQRAILAHDPALGPPARTAWPLLSRARRLLRRPGVLAAVGAVLLLGAIGAATVELTLGADAPLAVDANPDSAVFLNAGSGRIVGHAPAALTVLLGFGLGSLWSASIDGQLVQINPTTHAVQKTIPIGVQPNGLAVGAGSVWVTDSNARTLLRVNPAYGTVDKIALPSSGPGSASTAGGVAVAAGRSGSRTEGRKWSGSILGRAGSSTASRWEQGGGSPSVKERYGWRTTARLPR